jgi:23S rRNA G2445 N2-methylase RlmL
MNWASRTRQPATTRASSPMRGSCGSSTIPASAAGLDARLSPRLGRSVGDEALWAALAQDLQRRLRARTSKHVGADAEVWMAPGDFAKIRALAQQIADLIHERARPPHARGAIHGSVTALAFKLRDGN